MRILVLHRVAAIVGCMLICLTYSSLPAAVVYDLAGDWNPPNNPNGTWAYLSGATLMPYQASVTALGGAGGYAPSPSNGYYLPLMWKSAGTLYAHSYDQFNGNAASGEASITWTSPVNGSVDITGFMYYDHAGVSRSNDFLVNLGADTLASGTVSYLVAYDEPHKLTFSFTGLPVTVGEVFSVELHRTTGYDAGATTAMNWTITAVPESATVPGDANRDGIVDQADYTVWYNNYGTSGASWSQGDFTGDGLIDQADYTIWYNNYGSTGGSVPEPATLSLLALGGLAMLKRRK